MGIRSFFSKPLASYIVSAQKKWASQPFQTQERMFRQLIDGGKNTKFGKEHSFDLIKNYDDFRKNVPVRDYEQIRPYMERIIKGEPDVLWKGFPVYFAKTSGTTSGVKYIPITSDSIHNHINGAKDAILSYIHETGRAEFIDGKLIFLSGSPVLDMKGPVKTGRLSGIVNHHVPGYLRTNQLPSYETNCIEDWETKLEKIIDETIEQNMTLISGIPPWVQMYFDKIVQRTGKPIKDVFQSFSMLIYGGVNFEPYRRRMFDSIGKKIDSIETYPASEGFIAFQDSQTEEGLLLLLNSGIFYEFILAEEFYNEMPRRLSIEEVELNKNYAVVINSNAGLWGYSIGDTVKFISKQPYKILVTGRVSHFISAFGEHVIGEEVEQALKFALERHPETEIVEFTVAPKVNPGSGLPRHEWYIEFSILPKDLNAFENDINLRLQKLNTYYDDLISGKILSGLKIISLNRDAFRMYMKSQGKLGGQNKTPRLANDRQIADELLKYAVK